jgi:hypothetical protein
MGSSVKGKLDNESAKENITLAFPIRPHDQTSPRHPGNAADPATARHFEQVH